ncbi:ornithine decarboxylase [Tremella mesenterica]|uniref:ornithine decarboxylase n=1 Tax=Tremella mesenterica TaxID=5217 RepID=A0A4Q1BRI8_TREME|nr:ornithine decarboxylase [Tremella mesenterica]
MSTTVIDRFVFPSQVVGWSSEETLIPTPLSTSNAPTSEDLLKVLDPNAQMPYSPQHYLPTPPTTSPLFRNKEVTDLDPIADINIHEMIQSIIADKMEDEAAFFAADLSAVFQAVQMWRQSPMGERVEIFYAVKCNPSPPVLHLLSLLGLSFDCASTSEVTQVLSLPVKPNPKRIIYANPCKPASHIRAAQAQGVEMMTFDNADELYKIKRLYPQAKLVLRMLTDDSKSLCRLGLKYGAPLSTCPGLFAVAKQLGLNVIGVSFHVGSGCKDPMLFADAIWRARKVFDMGKSAGYDFTLLDVGGGFERATFAEMSQVVRDSLDLYFPVELGIRVIAEPGRLLVSSAFTLATHIIARRRAIPSGIAMPSSPKEDISEEDQGNEEGTDVMYYINDGVYGSFNCIMFDHQIVHPYPLSLGHSPTWAVPSFPPPPNVHLPVDLSVKLGYVENEKASVWGPTCDSIDCVRETVKLPKGLEVGDWLGWGEMGAYTLCAASTFNG